MVPHVTGTGTSAVQRAIDLSDTRMSPETARACAASTEPLLLTELENHPPGLARLTHGLGTARRWPRLLGRAAQVSLEVARALPADIERRLRGGEDDLVRVAAGRIPGRPGGSRSVALYAHYSPCGRISEMVRQQLHHYAAAGFEVVVITMAEKIAEEDWAAASASCALLVRRRNFGRDFGAWRDVVREVLHRRPEVEELLLVNDSVLGPIRPLGPVMDALRGGGEGLFGLTESMQGGSHLQSYLLLARGRAAVEDLADILCGMRCSHSKWLIVQRGELRLAREMRRRGHRVAALFGYARLVAAAAADPAERVRLAALDPRLRTLEALPAAERTALLLKRPLNPTHHLWAALVRRMGFPFIKTELVLRNPGRLPDVGGWAELVPPDAPCPPEAIAAHLAAMSRPGWRC